MLSIEAARATGYRDSLYYFRRNPLLVKITLTQSEKEILIAEKILSQNLRSRIVTMVTARTAFMMGGSKLVKGGYSIVSLESPRILSRSKRGEMGYRRLLRIQGPRRLPRQRIQTRRPTPRTAGDTFRSSRRFQEPP